MSSIIIPLASGIVKTCNDVVEPTSIVHDLFVPGSNKVNLSLLSPYKITPLAGALGAPDWAPKASIPVPPVPATCNDVTDVSDPVSND